MSDPSVPGRKLLFFVLAGLLVFRLQNCLCALHVSLSCMTSVQGRTLPGSSVHFKQRGPVGHLSRDPEVRCLKPESREPS